MITEIVILAVAIAATAGFLALTRKIHRDRDEYALTEPWLAERIGRNAVRIVCARCGFQMTWCDTTGHQVLLEDVIASVGRDCSVAHEDTPEEAA